MKSQTVGESTSAVEVTNISRLGFWLFVKGTEHFLPFDKFAWFKEATIAGILNVVLHGTDHLHWPDLDVDLTLDSIMNPDDYPLVSKK